jgi:hypothetical protein
MMADLLAASLASLRADSSARKAACPNPCQTYLVSIALAFTLHLSTTTNNKYFYLRLLSVRPSIQPSSLSFHSLSLSLSPALFFYLSSLLPYAELCRQRGKRMDATTTRIV